MERSPRQRPGRTGKKLAAEGGDAPSRGAPGKAAQKDDGKSATKGAGGEAGKPASRARGLDRAVEIFQLLHAARKPLAVGEIARRLKAPRSTVYEIVNLFLAADILEYAGETEVFFGRAIYLYANDYNATHAMVRLGQEEVRRLAAQTGETVQFCMPVGNKYTVVSMQNSARLFRIGSDVGVLVPIPWTASGRFFVAHMSLAELKAFIPPEDFRLQDGRTIDPRKFLAEAKAAREAGICAIPGLVDDYATCVAAPVVDPSGRCVASICFIVSSATGKKRMDELSALLSDSARRLSLVPDDPTA
jgi:DNA-binding IclR family transcriptional regulator